MAVASPSPDNREFPHLGSYKIIRQLGSGGMSSVFKAIHEDSASIVALKVLPRKFAANPVLLQRFLREARSAENLDHPNIVAIYDYGFDQARHYLVLEFVEGSDLFDRVRINGPLDPAAAINFVQQVALGLDYAAHQGMIHRDVKPANLLLTPDGQAKIIDLGLALQADDEDERVTRHGTTVGTVDYMSPEQARDSRNINEQSDLYSLGCTFYYLVTGLPPYPGGTLADKLARHHSAEIPDVRQRNRHLPDDLAALIRRMMAKKPVDRFSSYAALIDGLNQIGKVSPPPDQVAPPDVLIDEDADSEEAIVLTIAAGSTPAPSASLSKVRARSGSSRGDQPFTSTLSDVFPPEISLADLAALDAEPIPEAAWLIPQSRRGVVARSSVVIDAFLEEDVNAVESLSTRRSGNELPLQTWIAAGIAVGILIAVIGLGARFALYFLRTPSDGARSTQGKFSNDNKQGSLSRA